MLSPYSTSQYDPANSNTTWYKMISMVPVGSRVLDIGCSTGTLGSVLKEERKATVVGVDINTEDVVVAKKVLDAAQVFDIENESFEKSEVLKDTFDVIIFADVLEHMVNPVKVLEKVKSLLKKDGRVIFSIPNMAHLYVRLLLLEGVFRYTETGLLDKTHLHFYDANEVARIFEVAHYAIQAYDCPTFDYPDQLINEKLQSLGLCNSKKFSEIVHRKEAVFFEYVGWAQPDSSTMMPSLVEPSSSSPLDEVLAFAQRIKDSYEKQKNGLNKKLAMTEQHVSKLESQIAELKASLEIKDDELRQINAKPVRFIAKKIIDRN